MENQSISFGGVTLLLEFPAHLSETIKPLLSGFPPAEESSASLEIRLTGEPGQQNLLVQAKASGLSFGFIRTELVERFLGLLAGEVAHVVDDQIVLHSAAVTREGHIAIIPGPALSGKSMLTAWLLANGYCYLTDKLLCLRQDGSLLECLTGPLTFRSVDYPRVADVLGNTLDYRLELEDKCLTFIKPSTREPSILGQAPSLIIFPRFVPGQQTLTLEALSSARAGLKLMGCLLNARNLGGKGFHWVSKLARNIPALDLTYGGYYQLGSLHETLIPFIADRRFSPREMVRFFAPFRSMEELFIEPGMPPEQTQTNSESKKKIPLPTPVGPKKRLTIGMATYDDFDGVYFTVQAIRMYHPEVTEFTEILVIDNNPTGECAEALKALEDNIQGYRYLPYSEQSGTAVRDYIFRHANAEFVMSVDCHVLIVPGALKQLIEYFDFKEDCRDLLQGPMLNNTSSELSTHFSPEWREGMYGVWATDQRAADCKGPAFEIPMQGLGLFACRKEAWVGFNPRFRGFGGEEGYIHEKFRQSGGKTYCLPFLRWLHRFERPLGVPYKIKWEDRIYNYMVGFQEVGLETAPMEEHFRTHLGNEAAEEIFEKIGAELDSPFFYFDAVYCITLNQDSERWRAMQSRLTALGLGKRVRVFDAIATPENHHIGCALSHRSIIAEVKKQGLKNVVVFEDDAIFLDKTISCLEGSVRELKQQNWRIFYLGGHKWGQSFPLADQCHYLAIPTDLTCSHAIAYNESVFDKILSDIPDTVDAVEEWLKKNKAIDQYLPKLDGLYLAEPVVASQPSLLPQEREEHRARFTLGKR